MLKIQVTTNLSIALSLLDEADGALDLINANCEHVLDTQMTYLTLLNTLMMTRKRITRRDMRPGTI